MIDGLIEKKTNLSRNALIYTELKKKKKEVVRSMNISRKMHKSGDSSSAFVRGHVHV